MVNVMIPYKMLRSVMVPYGVRCSRACSALGVNIAFAQKDSRHYARNTSSAFVLRVKPRRRGCVYVKLGYARSTTCITTHSAGADAAHETPCQEVELRAHICSERAVSDIKQARFYSTSYV
jgi:hypothetical protein